MLRIIIAGTRSFDDYASLKETMDRFIETAGEGDPHPGVEIVSGMAKGADLLGVRYAKEKGYPVLEFPADWSRGRSAGPQRNRDMANTANACVVFWDGKSRGTASMIKLATAKKLRTLVVQYTDK